MLITYHDEDNNIKTFEAWHTIRFFEGSLIVIHDFKKIVLFNVKIEKIIKIEALEN